MNEILRNNNCAITDFSKVLAVRNDQIKKLKAKNIQLRGLFIKYYSDLYEKAIAMEQGAKLSNTKGLGRSWNWQGKMKQDELFSLGEMRGVETCGCLNW
tara:strand:- start:53 stop:349 length:297 start_codon:yes stop_codon:yes gene_type:complete